MGGWVMLEIGSVGGEKDLGEPPRCYLPQHNQIWWIIVINKLIIINIKLK